MKVKIGLIGNSNNNFFSLCRHLIDLGYDAHLFLLNNELSHFSPSSDTYSLDFMRYTTTVPFGNLYWFCEEVKALENHEIIHTLKNMDVIFACGSAVAYLEYFDIRVDFFVPYGMDLVKYPFHVDSANPNHRSHLDAFSRYQAKGIKRARMITGTHDMASVAAYREALEQLGVLGASKTFKAFPYIYEKIYTPNAITQYFGKCDWHEEFFKIKQESQMVIFSHARHTWKSFRGKIADKANDKIFFAFKEALDDIKSLNPKIITFEYGDDFLETKSLIKELKLEPYVIWMPVMRRKDIMVGLHHAHLAMGQFFVGCMGGGVQTEALVAASPLIHHVSEDKRDANLYPYAQAFSVNDIAFALKDYASCPSYYIKRGQEASRWMEAEIQHAVDELCRLI